MYVLISSSNIVYKNDIVFIDSQKYSGFIYQLSNTNDTLEIDGYANGKLHGVSKKWFPSKQLKEIRYYNNGAKEGKQESFWENGNKKFSFVAKQDYYEGELKEWDENGKLYHLAHYEKGQEEGVQKLWYDNGKIRANYVILKGKRYGLLGTKNCKNVSDSIFNNQ
ncbi:toxin-antitoxin system YwqK family antitoxin [Flavobacterium sp. K5-23]|nr:toxin-antitoxin system YwqK family antitoxin [Flavobacterium sp. K5-23]